MELGVFFWGGGGGGGGGGSVNMKLSELYGIQKKYVNSTRNTQNWQF